MCQDDVASLLKDDISKLTEKKIQLENDLANKIRKIEENEEIWSRNTCVMVF